MVREHSENAYEYDVAAKTGMGGKKFKENR
jgi:hypothetical protein